MATATDKEIVQCLVGNGVQFITSLPCKQLAGVIDLVEREPGMRHVPCTREDEGLGMCVGAHLGGRKSAILMQNTALGVIVNAIATLVQYYHVPVPMIVSHRGEVGEPVACQVEMALHTRPLLDMLKIPSYSFTDPGQIELLDGILGHCFMSRKPVAVLAQASFWSRAQ
ncbi:MAG: sulfopyruvate decarboxylase subunit alpha [Rhodobacteraceae bacterium]|nr:sulfopyruvate decarboxylase subunit alpha [Paracoccaceae bacterium]